MSTALIFECGFYNKQLPTDLKYAAISPIYRKGPVSDVSNYRPVSLTWIMCAVVMASIIRDKVMSHYHSNKLFTVATEVISSIFISQFNNILLPLLLILRDAYLVLVLVVQLYSSTSLTYLYWRLRSYYLSKCIPYMPYMNVLK